MRMSGGSTLIFGPSNAQIYSSYPLNFNGGSQTTLTAVIISVPNEILQIDEDLITLWRRDRNVYQKHEESVLVSTLGAGFYGIQESAEWTKSVFHPVWMKTRNGFKVNVDIYRAAPSAPLYVDAPNIDCVSEGGQLLGYKVSSNNGATWFQVGGPAGTSLAYPVSFGGMSVPGTTGLICTSNNEGLHDGVDDNWQPGTTNGYGYCPPITEEWTKSFAALGFSADSITYGDLTTSFQWGGPQGQLSRLTTPNGKTYTFTHEMFTGMGPSFAWAELGSRAWDFDISTPYAKNFWSSVTRMDVSDGDQTRSTYYHWRVPQVDPGSPSYYGETASTNWTSRTQGVAQTLPDGQTILHVFAPSVDLPMSTVLAQSSLPVSTAILDQSARTFMAQRQTLIARYYYAQGETGWNDFISSGADPESSNWYKRELMEGFDLRSWEASLTQITSNTEPRPTRTIQENKGGPVEIKELDGWDASRNHYAVFRVYHLPPGTSTAGQFWAPGLFGGNSSYPSVSGVIDLTVTTTTFAPVEAGLFARPQGKVST
jgi:hypothetical protein